MVEPLAYSIEDKLRETTRISMSVNLTHWESSALFRAVQVLRRIADGECTNAQIEARDILKPLL